MRRLRERELKEVRVDTSKTRGKAETRSGPSLGLALYTLSTLYTSLYRESSSPSMINALALDSSIAPVALPVPDVCASHPPIHT